MVEPSSKDLHPESGGRFVFERLSADADAAAPRYRVNAYLPGQRSWSGEVHWVDEQAIVEGPEASDDELSWARAEVLKLARVLHRDPKPKLVRWRGPTS